MSETSNLATALAAFQAELPKIIKDETAKVPGKDGKQGYTYGYADLAAVAEAVMPILGKHGLAFTSKPTMTEKGFGLVYALVHGESDERDEGFWPLQMGPMQQMGSAITYARRYALMAATGVFPDKEDDDGAAASQRGSQGGYDEWENASRVPHQRQAAARPVSAPPASAPTPDEASLVRADIVRNHPEMSAAEIQHDFNEWTEGKHDIRTAPVDVLREYQLHLDTAKAAVPA